MLNLKNCAFASLAVVFILAMGGVIGCADRDDVSETEGQDSASLKRIEAFNRAQLSMEKAGIAIKFSDVGDLANLATILPDPLELGQLEDASVIQSAISSFYEVLDASGERISVAQAPAIPAQVGFKLSDSDRLLVHLHLAYLYVLEAVRILAIEGWGKDGIPNTEDDLFRISFPQNAELKDLETVYQIELTERGEARFEQIANSPNNTPKDFLKEFRASERQAILDALVLLISAKIKTPAFPGVLDIDGQPIEEQTPQVNRAICRQDALFHLEIALQLARQIAPDLGDAFDDFDKVIAKAFIEDCINKALEWGFEIENEKELLNRIFALIGE